MGNAMEDFLVVNKIVYAKLSVRIRLLEGRMSPRKLSTCELSTVKCIEWSACSAAAAESLSDEISMKAVQWPGLHDHLYNLLFSAAADNWAL
jgi:hypothetical protein